MEKGTIESAPVTQKAKAFDLKKNMMLFALIGLVLVFQVLIVSGGHGNFFDPTNITNLIGQNSYVVILAVGMLICILTGGNIDLSVGSGVCMISAIAGVLIVNQGINIYLSIVICLLIGIGMGAFQGYFIAYVRIPAFIVTLAGMLLFRGIGYIILNGYTISPFPEEYTRIFNGFIPPTGADESVRMTLSMVVGGIACVAFIVIQAMGRARKQHKGYPVEPLSAMLIKLILIVAVIFAAFYLFAQNKGIPVVLITLAVIIFVYHWYTSKTVPGRHLYAMGGNEKAAIFSGVNTNRVMFFAYTNMGFLVAVASLVCIARFNSAAPSAGNMYELDAIGACFIGGASAYGGVGTVGGSVIGAVFMGVLNNGMSILGIDANWQRAVKGIVLLVAVLLDISTQKKRGTSGVPFGGMFRSKKTGADGTAAEAGGAAKATGE
jgi:putative multiple sugar transport system permease protein